MGGENVDTNNGQAPEVQFDRAGKYLTFDLANEQYGVGILQVREIIGLMEITAVPHTPAHIKGVINLRGSVIPVLDLRIKFDMEPAEYNDRTCIIVVEVQAESSTILVGMIVDSVSEVLNILAEEVEPPPAFAGDETTTEHFLGMAKVKGDVKILLDIDNVIGKSGLAQFETEAAE